MNLKQNARSRTEEQNHHRGKKMLHSQKPRIRRTLIGSLDKQGVRYKQSKAVNREFSLQDNHSAHYDTTKK